MGRIVINLLDYSMLPLKSKVFLFPYWAVLSLRHLLYDRQIKKSVEYSVPVICVGNITVGGTGKTPFTEMVVRRIEEYFPGEYNIMVLSRGYRRKTRGYRVVSAHEDYLNVGDEPLQIKNKFPQITVAVCEDRRVGIERLLRDCAGTQGCKKPLVILDDAFQHRRVKPSSSVLLMSYNRPVYSDNLLPIGRLRDLPEQMNRAQSIVVTNSPLYFSDDEYVNELAASEFIERETPVWEKELMLKPEQRLFFAATAYNEPLPVFDVEADKRYLYSKSAVLFSGIANDSHLREHIRGSFKVLDSLVFPDHCNFGRGAVRNINGLVAKYPLSVIFTTEKDSVRLANNRYLSNEVKKRLFYIPIETRILSSEKEREFLFSLVQ